MLKTTILLADAQYLVRVGLRCILAKHPDFEVVGEVANEEDLAAALQVLHPDVVILDYDGPDNFSRDSINTILAHSPAPKILIISEDRDKNAIFKVLESGVQSFLTKTCDEQEIADAVRAAVKGDKFFCTRIVDILLEKSFGKADSCAPTPLSPREIEIVQLVAKGYIAKEIADLLHLSTHTVYTHRKNIMKKLQLQTPSELMLYALNNGILELN
ncbi:MAG: response regulator transcription factor [Saprospiraceae bacterium]|nr:response regulator transcription factor [Saprospiraceae bacterium]